MNKYIYKINYIKWIFIIFLLFIKGTYIYIYKFEEFLTFIINLPFPYIIVQNNLIIIFFQNIFVKIYNNKWVVLRAKSQLTQKFKLAILI